MEEINKNCGIYKITSPSGRVYIGQAVDLKRRLREYKNGGNTYKQRRLHASLKKYSFENHHFDIIEYCNEEGLNCSERFWQDEFKVLSRKGLNCVLQNCGDAPRIASKETRQKQSDSAKGRVCTEETRKKISHFHKNSATSKEHLRKLKELNKGRAVSEETREKLRKAHTGKKMSPEAVEKIVLSKKGIPFSQERKDKMKEYNQGGRTSRSKLVLCQETGIFYDCAVDAAYALSMSKSTLANMLNPNRDIKNRTSLIYV